MTSAQELLSLSDDELLERLSDLLSKSRRVEADLIAHIGEVDARGLYAGQASSSMFAYCVDVLHLSEAEAYLRIGAARASRKYPRLLEMLRDGRLHLSGVGKLAPHLTEDNHEQVLSRATYKTKRQIEELVAELAPKPDIPAVIRKLPDRTDPPPPPLIPREELRPDGVPLLAAEEQRPTPPPASPSSPPPVHQVQPLAPSRYKVSFTASGEWTSTTSTAPIGRGSRRGPSPPV